MAEKGNITDWQRTFFRDEIERDAMMSFKAEYPFPSYQELVKQCRHLHITKVQHQLATHHYNSMVPQYYHCIERMIRRHPHIAEDEAQYAYHLFFKDEAVQRTLASHIRGKKK